MNAELFWGLPVIFYLFLAGVGAGALTVSSSVLLRGGGQERGLLRGVELVVVRHAERGVEHDADA